MRCIADREPISTRPGRAVIDQPTSDLVRTREEAEFHTHDGRGATHKAVQDEMGIAARHCDGVRVKVEACPVTLLSSRTVVGDIDRDCIVDNGLHTSVSYQC